MKSFICLALNTLFLSFFCSAKDNSADILRSKSLVKNQNSVEIFLNKKQKSLLSNEQKVAAIIVLKEFDYEDNKPQFITRNYRWVFNNADGEYFEGVLIAYNSKTGVGYVRESGKYGQLGHKPDHLPSGLIRMVNKNEFDYFISIT